MALLASRTALSKGVVVSVPVLVLSALVATVLLFFLLSSLSSCSCPSTSDISSSNSRSVDIGVFESSSGNVPSLTRKESSSGNVPSLTRKESSSSNDPLSTRKEDVEWVKDQIRVNGLHMHDNVLRKGINPRTRAQQLEDLRQFKGISHYEKPESDNHTAFPCPGELLVEEHHSNYGEPWAGGRDVFEFLAQATQLRPESVVLEIGCGTLRVGLHFIRYLNPEHFHCLERDELSLMAALRYELPSQGLLHKRPLIFKGEDMDFSKFGSGVMYDLIYASAVFLHMPDKLVWTGLERLASKLKPYDGRIYVSHNIKFCSRLGGEECTKRLASLGLEYLGKHTHDSLLFNHYEIWFEFRRSKA